MGGLHPLCGIGVISLINVISIPVACIALIAVSRPDPGPFTITSACFIPCSIASLAALSAAVCAAKGVPFLVPLNPQDPDEHQDIVDPLISVMVIIVLLKVD